MGFLSCGVGMKWVFFHLKMMVYALVLLSFPLIRVRGSVCLFYLRQNITPSKKILGGVALHRFWVADKRLQGHVYRSTTWYPGEDPKNLFKNCKEQGAIIPSKEKNQPKKPGKDPEDTQPYKTLVN